MDNYVFYYKVIYYLDSDQPEAMEQGFILATDYGEAAKIIDETYEALSMELKMIGDGPCICIPTSIDNFDLTEWEEANGY